MNQKSRVLIGIPSLCAYLSVSRPTIYKYLKRGMPGIRIDGTWHFHADHVEEFFRRLTIQKDVVKTIEDLEEEEVFPGLSSK